MKEYLKLCSQGLSSIQEAIICLKNYKKAPMEVLTTDGSSLCEGKIDKNTTVSTEMEYNITSVTSKNNIVDHIHHRKVETKGKSKSSNIPLVSTSNHDIICFSFLTYVNGQIFTSNIFT